MKIKKYKKIKLIMTLLVFTVLTCSIMYSNALTALLGLGVYMLLIGLLRIRVQGVLVDERQQEAVGKASQISFQILMPILLFSSITLILGGGNEEFHYYIKSLGIILSYITCLGLIIYILVYYYFDRKSGGR
ncbi:DUF2178 domain-containing protein [Patescibacteria group bacterium]|nr:DUF2178 domain-containing protein [Patescibacteria group bacterium]